MIDPLTLFMIGAGALAFREMNRKDYGVLTAARDERYRNAMEHCHDSQTLLQEAKLFAEHGLKAQAAMLKRRAEWRSRSEPIRKQHEAIYQKAMASTNIQAILEVAAAFEGWTATKKASALRERAQKLHEEVLRRVDESTEQPETIKTVEEGEEKKTNGIAVVDIPQNTSEEQKSPETP